MRNYIFLEMIMFKPILQNAEAKFQPVAVSLFMRERPEVFTNILSFYSAE